MARPKKPMSARERLSYDEFMASLSAGVLDLDTNRIGMGVLRGLAPEFAIQLKPRRGAAPNNDRLRRVLNHYAILSNPRYRDSHPKSKRGPLAQPEIIKRIAETEGITTKHVLEILANELIETQQKTASEAKRLQQSEVERQLKSEKSIRSDYQEKVLNQFNKRSIRTMAGFSGAFRNLHELVIGQLCEIHPVDDAKIRIIVEADSLKIFKKLEAETFESIKYR